MERTIGRRPYESQQRVNRRRRILFGDRPIDPLKMVLVLERRPGGESDGPVGVAQIRPNRVDGAGGRAMQGLKLSAQGA
jgi:hypothetical protein